MIIRLNSTGGKQSFSAVKSFDTNTDNIGNFVFTAKKLG